LDHHCDKFHVFEKLPKLQPPLYLVSTSLFKYDPFLLLI
jgi:hypothetical protein